MVWTIATLWWLGVMFFTLTIIGVINAAWDGALFCAGISMATTAAGEWLFRYAKNKRRAKKCG